MIETAPVGLTGFQADDWLRDERHIDVELVDHRRIMPLITFAHGEDDIERLVAALRDLVDEQGEPGAAGHRDAALAPRAAHGTGDPAPRSVLRRHGARQAGRRGGADQRRARNPVSARDPDDRPRRGVHRGDRRVPRAGRRGGRLYGGRPDQSLSELPVVA
jgi:hypothetical protein